MILTNTGVLKLMQRIKSFITSQLNTKANSVHTHTLSEIDDLSSLQMGGGYTKSEVDTLLTGKSDTSHTHTKSQIIDFPSYGTTANTICEGNDSRLSDARTPKSHTHTKSEITDFPTIPTVNNATLTIQKNGTNVKTFTANASSDVTCNITVPSKTSDLTNDSGFLTSHQSLSNYSTLANTIKSLSISGKTITYTKGDNSTGTLTTQDTNTTYSNFVKSGSGAKAGLVPAPSTTAGTTKYLREDGTWQVPPDHTYTVNNATLTIQKNGSNVATFTSNASSNVTANISVPTKVSQLTNDSGFITSSVSALEMKGNPPYIDFHASNDATKDYTSRIIDDGTNNTGRLRITVHYNSANYQVEMYKNFFEPVDDNDIYLGDSTNRWKNIFGATGTISTSDQRVKNSIENINDSLLDAWENVEPKQYKFNDATESKGEQARFHTGYLAQDIEKACADNNIDATRYGLFCYDSWEEEPEISEDVEVENDGIKTTEKRIIRPKHEKGDAYSLRYEEALVVECAYLRREISRLKEELNLLKTK